MYSGRPPVEGNAEISLAPGNVCPEAEGADRGGGGTRWIVSSAVVTAEAASLAGALELAVAGVARLGTALPAGTAGVARAGAAPVRTGARRAAGAWAAGARSAAGAWATVAPGGAAAGAVPVRVPDASTGAEAPPLSSARAPSGAAARTPTVRNSTPGRRRRMWHILSDPADVHCTIARKDRVRRRVYARNVDRAQAPQCPPRPPGDVVALSRLAFHALSGVASRVEEMHRAIARRAFAGAGRPADPIEHVHDAITGGLYATVRGIGDAAGLAIEATVAQVPGLREHRVSATGRGEHAVAALGGFFGDRFAREGSELALEMVLRHDGRDLPREREALAAALPAGAEPRRAVLLIHGLCETDAAWHRNSERRGVDYGDGLAADLGYVPLYLRYNTGLHISENGRLLSAALEQLAAAWPAGGLEELILIGHSMGGLVARSALHVGNLEQRAWVRCARDVFCLGSPLHGSLLEQGVNALGSALKAFPEAASVARVLELRSAGIKDLRHGYCRDEDWDGLDPDARLDRRHGEFALPDGVRHYFIGATVTRDPDHPIGRLLGDTLVRAPSASGHPGRPGRPAFRVDGVCRLGGLSHRDLVGHPAVYDQIRAWLDAAPVPPAPATAGATPA